VYTNTKEKKKKKKDNLMDRQELTELCPYLLTKFYRDYLDKQGLEESNMSG
jgi:hypothetical protein